MAAKSFGSFGAFKLQYLKDAKKIAHDAPIDISPISHTTNQDIEYFQKNLARSDTTQKVTYTWEKSTEESPSIYTKLPLLKPESVSYQHTKLHQHTLEIMAPYKGFPHTVKQNSWEIDPNGPPEFKNEPQKRRTAVLSSMTQYEEVMKRTFPGADN